VICENIQLVIVWSDVCKKKKNTEPELVKKKIVFATCCNTAGKTQRLGLKSCHIYGFKAMLEM